MELSKEEVIKRVKGLAEQHRIDVASLVVCGGAALTVYGIRQHAKDIDLQAPGFFMYKIRGWATKAVTLDNGRTITLHQCNEFDIGNMMERYFSSAVHESGLRLQTLNSIYFLKTSLSKPRQIDLDDIAALRKILNIKS